MVFVSRGRGRGGARGRGRGVGEVAFESRGQHSGNQADLRITVGNDKYRDREDAGRRQSPPRRESLERGDMYRRDDALYRREAELYGRSDDRRGDDRYPPPREYDQRDSYPFRQPEEREYGDRRGLGAGPPGYPSPGPPPSREIPPGQEVPRAELMFPVVSRSPGPYQPSPALPSAPRPLKSILKKKADPAEASSPKASGLPGISNYMDDIEDEDKFLYGGGDDEKSAPPREHEYRSYEQPFRESMRSAAQTWQPSAPTAISSAVSDFVSDQRDLVDSRGVEPPRYSDLYQQQPQQQAMQQQQPQAPAAEAGGDLWSMLAKTVQTVQQQQQQVVSQLGNIPTSNQYLGSTAQTGYGMSQAESMNTVPPSPIQQAPVQRQVPIQQPVQQPVQEAPEQKQGAGYDPTIENILKSIGFDFEMSKRMQEKAKHGSGEAVPTQQKPDNPAFAGLNENASFIESGSGMSHDEMRSQLAPGIIKASQGPPAKDRQVESRGPKRIRDKLERGCSPVSDEGSPPPPVFNLPPITIKRRTNLERNRSPGWERMRERSESPDPERQSANKGSGWTRTVVGSRGMSSHSPDIRRRSPSPERRASSRRSPSPDRKRGQSPVITRTFNLDGLVPTFKRRFSPGRRSDSRSPKRRSRSPGRRSRSPSNRRRSRSKSRSPRRRSRSPRIRRRSPSPVRGRKRGYSRSRSRDRDRKARRSSSRERRHSHRRSSSRDRRRSRSSSRGRERRRSISLSSDSDPDGPANKKYFSSPLRLHSDSRPKFHPNHPPPGPPPGPPFGPPGMVQMGPGPGFLPGMPPPGMPGGPPQFPMTSGPPPGFFPPGPPPNFGIPPPVMVMHGVQVNQPPPELIPPGTIEMPLELPKRTIVMSGPRDRSRDRSPDSYRSGRRRSRSSSRDRFCSRSRSRSRERVVHKDNRMKTGRRSRTPERRKSPERRRSRDRSRERDRSKNSDSSKEKSRTGTDSREQVDARGNKIVLPTKSTKEKEKEKKSATDTQRTITVSSKAKAEKKDSPKDDDKEDKDTDITQKKEEDIKTTKDKVKIVKMKDDLHTKIGALQTEFDSLKKQEDELKSAAPKPGTKNQILEENTKLREAIKKELVKLRKQHSLLLSKFPKILNVKKEISPKKEAVSTRVFKIEKGALMKHCFVDEGGHWCKLCRKVSNNIHDYIQHIHSVKHKQTMQRKGQEVSPWREGFQPNDGMIVNKNGIRVPIPGTEFLLPSQGYYCQLCKVLLGDTSQCLDHVRCESHYLNYKKYLKDNPFYEKKYKEEKRDFLKHHGDTAFEIEDVDMTPKEKNQAADARVRENEKKWDQSVENLDDAGEVIVSPTIAKTNIKLSLKGQVKEEKDSGKSERNDDSKDVKVKTEVENVKRERRFTEEKIDDTHSDSRSSSRRTSSRSSSSNNDKSSQRSDNKDDSKSSKSSSSKTDTKSHKDNVKEEKADAKPEQSTEEVKSEDYQDKTKINLKISLGSKKIIGKAGAPKKNPLLPAWQPVSKNMELASKPGEKSASLDSFLTTSSGDGKIPVVKDQKKKLSAKDVLASYSDRQKEKEEQAAREKREREQQEAEIIAEELKREQFQKEVEKQLAARQKMEEEMRLVGIDPESDVLVPLAEVVPPPPPSQNVPHPDQRATATISDVHNLFHTENATSEKPSLEKMEPVGIGLDLLEIPLPEPMVVETSSGKDETTKEQGETVTKQPSVAVEIDTGISLPSEPLNVKQDIDIDKANGEAPKSENNKSVATELEPVNGVETKVDTDQSMDIDTESKDEAVTDKITVDSQEAKAELPTTDSEMESKDNDSFKEETPVPDDELQTELTQTKRGRSQGRGRGRGCGRVAKVTKPTPTGKSASRSTRSLRSAAVTEEAVPDSDNTDIEITDNSEFKSGDDTYNKNTETCVSVESKPAAESSTKKSKRVRKISSKSDVEGKADGNIDDAASDASGVSMHMGSDFEVVDDLEDVDAIS